MPVRVEVNEMTESPILNNVKQIYLSVTSHINCIVARCLINVVYLMACAFIRS